MPNQIIALLIAATFSVIVAVGFLAAGEDEIGERFGFAGLGLGIGTLVIWAVLATNGLT